jgi:voltage-gated potassium channel
MNAFQENLRQLRIALIAITILIPTGVIGFMLLEQMTLLDAIWLTVITLATIGYGDVYAQSDAGRIFTIVLIVTGISAFAFAIQAIAAFFVSPAMREIRLRRRAQRTIDRLEQHYIVCGYGELVDKSIGNLLERAETRRRNLRARRYRPVDVFLDRLLGDDDHGHHLWLRVPLRRTFLSLVGLFQRDDSFLNIMVIVTHDAQFAEQLRNKGLLVIEGESSDDDTMRRAGIQRAQSIMVLLDSDTEAMLTILTARNLNPHLYITAAALDGALSQKMVRVGANNIIAPYEIAGRSLNNATLRPAVYSFFNSILFDFDGGHTTTQLFLWDDSPWIGKRLSSLHLREQHNAAVIGLRLEDGHFLYVPSDDYILRENEVVVVALPSYRIQALQEAVRAGTQPRPRGTVWQSLPPMPHVLPSGKQTYSLVEAASAIDKMSEHFVICGSDAVARNAVSSLDPERPFVIISDDNNYTSELIKRGFRVVHGNPTQEATLRKAGVNRALAIMVSIEDKADGLMTVLNCRALSKRLLITATAISDDMVLKLHRAGADRVASPFSVAAQYVLLATIRPVVSDFLQYVLYNYRAQIETTELYMQHDSPWIGSTIEELRLDRLFKAGVIGIRSASGEYVYAPPTNHEIAAHEVLIVVTPMMHSDELRTSAHGSATRRPYTLRNLSTIESVTGNRDTIANSL